MTTWNLSQLTRRTIYSELRCELPLLLVSYSVIIKNTNNNKTVFENRKTIYTNKKKRRILFNSFVQLIEDDDFRRRLSHLEAQIWANEITEKVCDEIKANDIELYTIAFEITDTATKELLKRCATNPDFYYDAKNSADLKAAFAQISDEFRDIALAK